MTRNKKIIIILFVIVILTVGIWLSLDSHTKCKLIYGKNICNFYEMMDTISHNPETSDFEKAMQLCREMENVPKKDSCFEYIAEVVSFYDTETAKKACDEIKEIKDQAGNIIYKRENCYNIIQESAEERLAKSVVVGFMEARLQRDKERASNWLTDNAKQQYSQPGFSLIGTSNPHFASFEILEIERLDSEKFKFKVRIYEEYTGKGRVGYFDETLTIIKSENRYLIDSVEHSEYTNL